MFIVKNEELMEHTVDQLEAIANFLKLSNFDWSVFDEKIVFSGGYDDKPDSDSIKLLTEYYRESNERLLELTGVDYTNPGVL